VRGPLSPVAHGPGLLAILVAILFISIVYSASVRRAFLMSDLQFIPVEDELLVVTGDLESLWEGVDHHFGAVLLDETREAGALTEGFRSLRETFQEGEEPKITSLDDLVRHGFDTEGGLLMSANHVSGSDEPSVLVVLPVAEGDTVTPFVSKLMDQEPEAETPDLDLEDAQVVSYEDVLLAYPDAGRALLTPDPDHLRRSVKYRDRNLSHHSADDGLYRVVRESLRGSLGSGPTVFGSWRPLAEPGIEQMTGVLTLHPDAVRFGVEVKVDAGVLRVLDDFLVPAKVSDDWNRFLGPQTAAALAVEDEALSDYLRFIGRFETVRSFMDDRYGGVLSALEELQGLRRMVLAVTGYRDGLPELLMGVWGDSDSLKSLVTGLQLRQREKRDRTVLEGALDALLDQGEVTPEDLAAFREIPLETLERNGLLVPEVGSTFRRYMFRAAYDASEGDLLDQGVTLMEEDINSAPYLRMHGSHTIRLLLPPVTDNDITYVPGLEEVDGDALRGDRYRLATVVLDSVLWVTTDVVDAQELINRAEWGQEGEVPDLSENEAFRAARATWSRQDRIQGFLDIDRLTTLGLLSPESEVEEKAKRLLLDLRNHPSVSLAVRSEEKTERILVNVAALLQRRLRDP